jgi:hypothetical protein
VGFFRKYLSRTGTRAVRDKYYPKKSEDRIIPNFKMIFPNHLRPPKTTCLSHFVNYRIVFRMYLTNPRLCAQIIFPSPRPYPECKRLSSDIIFILTKVIPRRHLTRFWIPSARAFHKEVLGFRNDFPNSNMMSPNHL